MPQPLVPHSLIDIFNDSQTIKENQSPEKKKVNIDKQTKMSSVETETM